MNQPLTSGSYYGQTAKSCQVAGLILTESSYRPGTEIPPHCHDNAFFYLVVNGTCREKNGSKENVAEPGMLVFHPALEPHANDWVGTEGRCFHVELGNSWIQRLSDHKLEIVCPLDHRGSLTAWLAMRMYREFQIADQASSLAIEGLALELLAGFARTPQAKSPSPPKWLEQARELLRADFACGLDVEAIARAVDIHPAHLVRSFRGHYRFTMGEYLRNLRVEFACRELTKSGASLAEIALNAGFSDQSHFSKTFKRITGLTPAQYQHQFRQCKPDTKE